MKNVLLLLFVLGWFTGYAQQKVEAESGKNLLDPAAYHEVRSGLYNSFDKFVREKKGRVAFMGGSITEHGAWREMVCQYLKERFPETTFDFINAGISSTGSTPGAFRMQKDVLSKGSIDLFFEEAAVNDPTNGFGPTAQLRGMEGIIRQALVSNPMMDIVLLHFVDPSKIDDYNNGRTPEVIRQHEKVAQHYGVNSLHLAKEVADRIRAGEFNWKDDFKDLHPSPFGHQVYFRSIKTFLAHSFSTAEDHRRKPVAAMPALLDKYSYSGGVYLPVSAARFSEGWQMIPDWTPEDGTGTRPQYVHVPALVGSKPGSPIRLSFSGRAIGICVVSGPDAGVIEYSIDGKRFKRADLFTKWSGGLHLPWYIVLDDELRNKAHELVLRISNEKADNSKGNACRILHFLVNKH